MATSGAARDVSTWWRSSMGREAATALARELLASHGSELENLVPHLVQGVSRELGLPEVPIEHEWLGAEAARGEILFRTLARSIRVSVRRIQSHVHRIVLYRGLDHDHEAVVELLERILEAGKFPPHRRSPPRAVGRRRHRPGRGPCVCRSLAPAQLLVPRRPGARSWRVSARPSPRARRGSSAPRTQDRPPRGAVRRQAMERRAR